jgi:Mrp family chromosome partitioning ATPase
LNSPVSSLLVGDRLVSRCDDGLLEAEYALFDRSEILLSPGVREEGYMTRAGAARARLHAAGVTEDVAHDAFVAMRGRLMRPFARSTAVRDVVDQLGPYETFQGGRFVAGRGRFTGLWLDLDALAAACPLRDASILLQAVHLLLALEEVGEDAPVRLLTTGNDAMTGGRTWRRVDLEAAQRLPWVLHEMHAPTRSQGGAYDEAEVREEILRDLQARAATARVAQARLGALAAAIARTGLSSAPPAATGRSSSRPPPPRPSPRPSEDGGPSTVPIPGAPPLPQPPIGERAADGADFSAAFQQRLRTATESVSGLPPPLMPATAVAPAVAPAPPQTTTLVLRNVKSSPPPYESPFGGARALDPRLVLLLEPDSQRSASFRLLRDGLLSKRAPRSIAVSSGAAGEGKTTCAINLALALSEMPSARVLLVEANFAAPSLADVFNIDATTRLDPELNAPALSPYRLVRVVPALDVAALVRQPGEAAPAFNSRWFETVIERLARAGYDHLVIDTGTLDGSPFTTQVVNVAGGTLLTARANSTTARALRRAAELIPEGRALGVTLMDGDSQRRP